MAEERIQLTREGYETLLRELEDARERVQRATEQLASVDNSADDNIPEEGAEYDIRVTQQYFDERVRRLEFVLNRAEIIEEDPDPERVNIGDRIIVWDFQDQQERVFDILSSEEAIQSQQGVSADSPVGKALLGRRLGDIIEVEVPDGKARYSVRRMETIPQDTEA
jgi:transcription elongation factor GreA